VQDTLLTKTQCDSNDTSIQCAIRRFGLPCITNDERIALSEIVFD